MIDGTLHENWGRPRERAVLGALLVHANRWVAVDTLIKWGWSEDEDPPRNLGPTFHHYAGRIRSWLRQMPVQVTLHPENGGYRLALDKSMIDYHGFNQLVAEARAHARRHDPQRVVDTTVRALGLWRGRPLADLAGEPARTLRLRLEQDDWLGANRSLLAALLDLGEFDEVLTRLGVLQTDHQDDVILATQRMSALHGLGRNPDEFAYYVDVRRRLQHDGDDASADHVRRHHESLRAQVRQPSPPPVGEPTIVPRRLGRGVPVFVGREGLLATLDALVATDGRPSSGVVVIDGMTGVGKTTLVTHWGHRARQHFPGGDLYMDLNGFAERAVVSPAAVVDEFLMALGHPPDGALNARERELLLSRLASGRRMLVVLDNARDAEHVEGLVALFPDALVLVTSRQQLTSLSVTTGARRPRIEPMTPDEATELLSVRIGDRREVAHEDLARLAASCGGLPLMITLLAERVASSPPGRISEFADQHDRRQLLLDGGAIEGRTFFDWSYRVLGGPERRLFRLLGMQPGPDFSVETAAALDGRTRVETMRGLRALTSAHLLEQPEALDRYRFHDLIREFAAYCAETDEPVTEREAALRRLVSYYLASAVHADRLLYPSRRGASELEVEHGVDPFVPRGAAQAKAWFDRERTNLLATILTAAGNGHHDFVWRLVDATVVFFNRHGYYADSVSMHKLAAASARIVGAQIGEVSSLVGIGWVYLTLGNVVEARSHLEAALRLAERMEHDHSMALVLNLLGLLEMERGDPVAALALYRRSMKIAQRIDDLHGQRWTACRMGAALRATEQHVSARTYLTRAQILAERAGDESARASTLIEVGLVHRDRGDYADALLHGEHALRIAEAIPDLVLTVEACLALAEINSARGVPDAAVAFARRAIAISGHGATARAHDVLGDVQFVHGHPAEAAAAWRAAVERYDGLGNPTRAAVTRAKLQRIPGAGVDVPQARSASQPPIDATVDSDVWPPA